MISTNGRKAGRFHGGNRKPGKQAPPVHGRCFPRITDTTDDHPRHHGRLEKRHDFRSGKEKALQLASNETMRLIRLVNENLDYEKIRSNQVTLSKQDIQLVELLEIIQDQLEGMAASGMTRIIVNCRPGGTGRADYDRLTQILINITKNSIQFTDNGTIYLRGFENDDATIIEIEDTGIGIDPADVEKIWRRFYKAIVSRTTNPYGEFGLGLSIVKQLVIMHDGAIDVLK